ncbi:MAG: iron ABC transporter permease [Thiomonas sp.]|jgi:iron(III) transport system permease protein|uniref:ABC transporter permease n=1 Tax=unclassified Thiomonas TaxID=2625466 RepID=UPI0004DBB394|nr:MULTISPECIES: iron ABC transporter permease [unclassified Thiomonas]CQR42673.1 Permease protein, ABC-type iron transporter [Thiomonas sp. CB3]MDY0329234.1 iron ABC transporter permease [Thiomonas sp.]CDW92839.1 putative Permease protein, ABC-type iron transporter [Thiomonas sp. CB2]VDY05452.1 Permease protein, ABC-type iron transporter [Thiomonas sp. Bio17B3]VDY07385.1 Permease protein, ABC-type iron transporter [Thiomonas sp. Sup16B3]
MRFSVWMRAHRRLQWRAETALALGVGAVLTALVALPLLRIGQQALWADGSWRLAAAWTRLIAPDTLQATVNSLIVSLGGTAVAVVFGTAYALLVGLTDLRGKRGLIFLLLLPLMIPPQITAMSWAQLLGPGSALLKPLGLAPAPGSSNPMYGLAGITLLLGLQQTPLVFLALRPGVSSLPSDLIEAAQSAGACSLWRLRTVLLPVLMPGVLAGAALSFVSCLDNFGIPALLGTPVGYTVLSTLIYQKLSGFGLSVLSDVAQLSLLAAALALLGLGAQGLLQRRWQGHLSGASSPYCITLGRWKTTLTAAAWALLIAVLITPALALLATSLVSIYGLPLTPKTLTWAHYQSLLGDDMVRTALRNSLWLAGWAAALTAAIALPVGYLVVWDKGRVTAALAALADLPFALPGAVVAVAAILMLLPPLPVLHISLYSSLWIILYAYLLRFLTLAIKPVVAGLSRLDPALNDAARSCGAGLFMRLRTIVWPLAAPLLLGGGILVFLMALNELTVSALLWSSGSETLGVLIYNFEEGGSTGAAAALSVLTIVAVLGLLGVLQTLSRRLPKGSLPWA